MKAAILYVLVCLILTVTANEDSHEKCEKGHKGHGKGHHGKHLKCKGQEANTDAFKPYFQQCKSKDDDEEQDRHTKFLVQDDKFNNATFQSTISGMYPGSIGDDLNTALDGCLTSENNIDNLSKDDDCKTYRPLIKCIFKTMKETCKEDKPETQDEDD